MKAPPSSVCPVNIFIGLCCDHTCIKEMNQACNGKDISVAVVFFHALVGLCVEVALLK